MQQTKLRLMLDYPFFGSLALTMPLTEDDSIPTLQVDGVSLKYNPEFTSQLTPSQKLFAYLHEICHVILGHSVRRGSRNPKLWNIAGDYAVNLLLSESTSLQLPPGTLFDTTYTGWSTERIYEALADEFQEEAQKYDPETSDPETSDPGNSPIPEEGENTPDLRAEARQTQFNRMVETSEQLGTVTDAPPESELTQNDIQSAAALVEKMITATGHDPGARIRQLVQAFTNTKISWKELLSRFICESCANKYNWMKPNKRYMSGGGVMLPSLISNDQITIAVAIDTSGSINNELLNNFMAEFKSLLESIEYRQLTIMSCSAQVFEPRTFQKGENIDFQPIGGGATAFAPVFEYVATMDETPACLIYFTDLFSDKFGQQPECPVLWIGDYGRAWEASHQKRIPFGEIVNMHE